MVAEQVLIRLGQLGCWRSEMSKRDVSAVTPLNIYCWIPRETLQRLVQEHTQMQCERKIKNLYLTAPRPHSLINLSYDSALFIQTNGVW